MSINKREGYYLVDIYIGTGNNRTRIRRKFKRKVDAKQFEIQCTAFPDRFINDYSNKNASSYNLSYRLLLANSKYNDHISIDLDTITTDYQINTKGIVYFLIMNTDIVYVGQTVQELGCRIESHKKFYAGKFNKVKYMEVPIEIISVIEASFIKLYSPKYNKGVPLVLSLDEAKAAIDRLYE